MARTYRHTYYIKQKKPPPEAIDNENSIIDIIWVDIKINKQYELNRLFMKNASPTTKTFQKLITTTNT